MADELALARDACDALRLDDPLRPKMRTLLETIGTRLEGNEGTSRGRRPALPDRSVGRMACILVGRTMSYVF